MTPRHNNSVSQAWQGIHAERWLQEQARTDDLLRPFGQAALTTLAAASGEWIIDVGCGAGTPSIEIAQTVGPAGGVCAIDISEPLLNRARERGRAAGLSNLRFALGDAATHRFSRRFDAAFSRFGVMFFEDPVAAFANVRDALTPSGRLAFVCWQALERNPWAHKPLEAARKVTPQVALPALLRAGTPGPFAFGDQDYLYDTLKAAGFAQVDITAFERPVHFGGAMSVDDAADYCMRVGPTSRFIADASPALNPRFREALVQVFAPHTNARGTWMDAATFVVSARG